MRLSLLVLGLLTLWPAASVFATPPAAISYQGRLTDADGLPLADSSWSIRFVLYRDSLSFSPADVLWDSGPTSVTTSTGLFSILLGASPMPAFPDSLFQDSLAWLGVTVGSDPEQAPRTRIVAVPYALSARVSDDLSVDKYVDETGDTIGGPLGVTGPFSAGTDQIEAPVTLRSHNNYRWDVGSGYGDLRLSDGVAGLGIGVSSNGIESGTIRFWSSGGFVENLFFGSPSFGDILELHGSGQTVIRGQTDWFNAANAGSRVSILPSNSQVSVIGTDGQNKVDLIGNSSSGAFRIRNGTGIASVTADGGDEFGGDLGLYRDDGLLTVYLRGGGSTISEGGSIDLWDGTGGTLPTISLHPDAAGDATVVVPNGAINSEETENEAGVASVVNPFQVTLGPSMTDIVVLTVSIPAHGYIVLFGSGQFETSGTTGVNDVIVQIDETAGGFAVAGQYEDFGLGGYVNTGANYFPISSRRVYFKTVGTYTFRLEGFSVSGGGSASCNSSKLTALYFPTSYGPVTTTTAEPNQGVDPRLLSVLSDEREVPRMTTYEVDLKVLEERAKQARQAAIAAELAQQQAERELAEARRKQAEQDELK